MKNNDKTPKPLIIFDFFGVIGEEIADTWLAKYMDTQEVIKFRNEVIVRADLGLISEDELFTSVGIRTGLDKDVVREAWLKDVSVRQDVVRLIASLKKDNSIALLSNAPLDFLHRILKRDNLYGLFDNMIISCEVGVAKPDPKIFKLVLDKFVNISKVCFIDDNINNVKAAIALGIKGIHYDSFSNVKKAIEEFLA